MTMRTAPAKSRALPIVVRAPVAAASEAEALRYNSGVVKVNDGVDHAPHAPLSFATGANGELVVGALTGATLWRTDPRVPSRGSFCAEKLRTLPHDAPVLAVAVTTAGLVITSAADGGQGEPSVVTVSTSGLIVAGNASSGLARVLDPTSGAIVTTLVAGPELLDVAAGPNDTSLTASKDTVKVWAKDRR